MPESFDDMVKSCSSFATFPREEYTVENNTWGSASASTFEQCIYATELGIAPPRFGWTWTYDLHNPNDVKAYPEIIYGKKPWASGSTTANLPRMLAPIPSLKVDFSIITQATGRFNAAFEIWLTDSISASGQSSITHEIMFWIGHQGSPSPAGTYQQDVTLADNRPCELWLGSISTWHYTAFVFHTPFTSGTLEFGHYLQYLLQQEILPPDRYIASLEFGNELWYGSGKTIVEHYQVTVGGLPPVIGPSPIPEPIPEPVIPPGPMPSPAGGGELPAPAGPAWTPDPYRAYIRMHVPSDALVIIDGYPMQSTAVERWFHSPPIEPQRDFIYRVKVVVERSGQTIEEIREVVVRAGTVAFYSFMHLT